MSTLLDIEDNEDDELPIHANLDFSINICIENPFSIYNVFIIFWRIKHLYNPVFLGEAESLANYLGTERQTTIYLTGEKGYFDNFLKPLSYLLKDQKFDIIEVEKDTEIVASRPLFYLAKNAKITDEQTQVTGHNIKETRIIGQSIIYKLKN